MIAKKSSTNWVGKAIFGLFFGIISLVAPMTSLTSAVYADVPSDEAVETVVEALNEGEITGEDLEEAVGEEESAEAKTEGMKTNEKTCKESLGALGWLVCPATGALSKAVDWLYEKIESILVLNPVEIKDGSPIYEVWKYMRGLTNVLFIIFLLIMVYSQVTGLGITNYGLKKTLPKLIVGAIVVNLSFVMCSLLVDVSNIVGDGLRDVFNAIEESTMATMNVTSGGHVSLSQMYLSLAGGTTMAVGAGVIAFETGAIWMMIPTVLGAIVAVVIGLVTIAMRQAVVALLIMIAPLAIVAYILPNTGKWFQQWKQLFSRMLVFYPMFSLLFGASSLAGWAIIASAKDGFFLLLGVAVQIFPLFFAWKLMSLSGTFLSTINARMHALMAKPLAANRAWADSHRELTRQKYLASNAYTPSLKLAQFLSDRKIARDETTAGHANTVKTRGQMYAVKQNYKRGNVYGALTRAGEAAYEEQARNAQYQQIILRHQNNMNKGGFVAANAAQKARIDKLDDLTIKAFDTLKMEQARTEKIDYDNAVGFHKRMEDAMNAHFDEINWNKIDKKSGNLVYKRHFATQTDEKYLAGLARYADAAKIMEGNKVDTQYTAAFAAHAYDTQNKTISTKYQKYFELLPPTKDLEYRLGELTKRNDAADFIDAIIPGLRVLNTRGDTDLVREQMMNVLKVEKDENGNDIGGVKLGTHASQALAGFLMFEVKDNDPWLRRFGKYINLETAHMYNKNVRQKDTVDYKEYVKGYYYEPDGTKAYPKKSMSVLMEGTSLDNIERTAVDNYINSVMEAYTEDDGVIHDYKGFEETLSAVNNATAPQLISAMRKTLSGSEGLVSMVKDVTGYEKHQKDDGSYELRSIFEDEKIQKRFGEHLDEYKQYRKKWAKTYLKGLLPSQVLSMRTDELLAFDKLLPNWFQEEHGDIHAALKKELADNYNDLSHEDRASLLKTLETREMFRECLGMGVLEQINRTNTRRGILDSKPMLRNFLGVDGDSGGGQIGLSKYIADKKGIKDQLAKDATLDVEDKEVERIIRELEEIFRQRKEAASGENNSIQQSAKQGLYTAEDLTMARTFINETYAKLESRNATDEFYDAVNDYLEKNIPIIVSEFEKYYVDNKDDCTIAELLYKIIELLGTIDI